MNELTNNSDLQKEALQQSVAVSKLTMDVLKQTKKQLRRWQLGFFALLTLNGLALLLYYLYHAGVIS